MSPSNETFRPALVDRPASSPDDPRLGDLLGRSVDGSTSLVIAGFPVDEGVRRNGGRPGAAEAPAEIRRWLLRMTVDPRAGAAMTACLARVVDLGDLVPSGSLERDQERLGEAIAPHLAAGRRVIVLGGGHETAFGTFLGHAGARRSVFIANLDAHPDVRPLRVIGGRPQAHSGSPFRQAIEHASGACVGYAVAGLQPQAVSAEHLDWMRERGATAVFADELPRDEHGRADLLAALPPWSSRPYGRGEIMASLDLDAVAAQAAPGVSAPSVAGIPVESWLSAAELLGGDPRVRSIDLVELSPPHDEGGRTARLAALTVWRFLRGATRAT